MIDDARIGGGRALGGQGESEELGNPRCQKAVISPCFTGEPEETEEDERAKDSGPPGDLVRIYENRVLVHHDPGDLDDAGVA